MTLHGAGQVTLSDDDGNVISGTSQNVTLNNVDNTISGAGQLGAGELDLINSGKIIATGSHSLTIDTGTNVIENSARLVHRRRRLGGQQRHRQQRTDFGSWQRNHVERHRDRFR